MARVLVVDDDRSVLRAFTRTLERGGHEVIGTSDGRSALDAYRVHTPDLVFCDVFMPGMNGAQLVIELRKQDPDARIVMVSGGGMFDPAEVLDSFEDLGIDRAVSKPCESEELLKVVSELAG